MNGLEGTVGFRGCLQVNRPDGQAARIEIAGQSFHFGLWRKYPQRFARALDSLQQPIMATAVGLETFANGAETLLRIPLGQASRYGIVRIQPHN